jgi:hypothetical protein
MAIDTEDKRRSVQAYTMGLMRPVADGTVDAADRATCAWFYTGLTYSEPPPPAEGYRIIPMRPPPPDWRWSTVRRPL